MLIFVIYHITFLFNVCYLRLFETYSEYPEVNLHCCFCDINIPARYTRIFLYKNITCRKLKHLCHCSNLLIYMMPRFTTLIFTNFRDNFESSTQVPFILYPFISSKSNRLISSKVLGLPIIFSTTFALIINIVPRIKLFLEDDIRFYNVFLD